MWPPWKEGLFRLKVDKINCVLIIFFSSDRSVGQFATPQLVEQCHRTFRLDNVFQHATPPVTLIRSQPPDSAPRQHFHRDWRAANFGPFFQPAQGQFQIAVSLCATFKFAQIGGSRTGNFANSPTSTAGTNFYFYFTWVSMGTHWYKQITRLRINSMFVTKEYDAKTRYI